jgi:hypothetical protein
VLKKIKELIRIRNQAHNLTVSKIQEYDLEIKPTKLIKGQGLAQMITKGNEQVLDLVCQNNQTRPTLSSELHKLEHQWY